MTPTQRSIARLRERGYAVAIVERWNHAARKRQDLWGMFDILAVRDNETLGVQTTSRSHVSERVDKLTAHENLAVVRKANWRIEVHGWGKMAKGWDCRVVDLS